jgi:alanyl-tRNA synthetase
MTRTSRQIRSEFIAFFKQRGHTFVPSSPLLPGNDPTLLFANAGMNQFKDVFLGTGTRPYNRAVNSQKCIRAGGKHNDLEDVGHDTYHHTFFEMLGNWSFGDYFKPEAIAWAWELLTEVWGLPKDKLWATYFGGGRTGDSPDDAELWRKLTAAGIGPDLEAAELWRKISNLPPERILPGSLHDNFWAPGDSGPCGPCSEIHFDFGVESCDGKPHPGQACAVNVGGCGRFIELWNLVFIQFNRDEAGKLESLPAKHVDTGAGFERICRVLQGKNSNYETDVFVPLIQWLEQKSGQKYGASPDLDVALRAVADHARACSFAIADGVLPSNDGRGYVIRRILRRAARFGRKLGLSQPFLYEMVAVLGEQMGDEFPEIRTRRPVVEQTILDEESSFNRTLDRGLELFEKAAAKAVNKVIGGDVAFELYATYGFPIDLTSQMAGERGLTVDLAGYDAEMARHREISSAGASFQASAITGLPETDDSAKYHPMPLEAKVLGWVAGDRFVTIGQLAPGAEAAIVLDETCFYGESGGQVGDTGKLTFPGGFFTVRDTKLSGHCVLHVGILEQGALAIGAKVKAAVDPTRFDTRRNHTATHLLNWALRMILGPHIEQAGSVVDPLKARFDFTHGQAVTSEQLALIEELVNNQVLADEPVHSNELPLAEAKKIKGVRAVFGEKYPDPVRVVSVGVADVVGRATEVTPVEFCGGSHLDRTSQVGLFKIVSEESVARGVRRITAVTGHEAVKFVQALDLSIKAACGLVHTAPEQLAERIAALQAEIKRLKKTPSGGGAGDIEIKFESDGGKLVVAEMKSAPDPAAMRTICDTLRKKGAQAALIGGAGDGKVTLLAMVSDELVAGGKVKAGDWVKAAAAVVEGSGGGKPNLAQAGGKNPEKLPQALEVAWKWICERING